MGTGKGDAPGMGFPTARRRRELYTAAAFGGAKDGITSGRLGCKNPERKGFF